MLPDGRGQLDGLSELRGDSFIGQFASIHSSLYQRVTTLCRKYTDEISIILTGLGGASREIPFFFDPLKQFISFECSPLTPGLRKLIFAWLRAIVGSPKSRPIKYALSKGTAESAYQIKIIPSVYGIVDSNFRLDWNCMRSKGRSIGRLGLHWCRSVLVVKSLSIN